MYGTVATVAHNATGTVSYTVTTGKTLYLKGVWAAASGGPAKVTVDYGSGPTTIGVGFFSTTGPYLKMEMPQPVSIAASTVVNVKIQNNAGAAQDVYATIFGHEV
jgi:hypothetical protein